MIDNRANPIDHHHRLLNAMTITVRESTDVVGTIPVPQAGTIAYLHYASGSGPTTTTTTTTTTYHNVTYEYKYKKMIRE